MIFQLAAQLGVLHAFVLQFDQALSLHRILAPVRIRDQIRRQPTSFQFRRTPGAHCRQQGMFVERGVQTGPQRCEILDELLLFFRREVRGGVARQVLERRS